MSNASGFPGMTPPLLTAALLALALCLGGQASAQGLVFRELVVDDPAARLTLDEPTLSRELAPVRFAGTLRTAEWLLDHPQIAAALARRLHPPLERYVVTPAPGGTFEVADQDALRGTLRLIGRGPDRRLYRCDGEFGSPQGALHVAGRLVLFLAYRALPPADGLPRVEMLPALFVRTESVFTHGIAKLLGPLLRGVIDRRVEKLAAATEILGRRVAQDPGGLEAEMRAWPEIPPADLAAFRRAFLPGMTAP